MKIKLLIISVILLVVSGCASKGLPPVDSESLKQKEKIGTKKPTKKEPQIKYIEKVIVKKVPAIVEGKVVIGQKEYVYIKEANLKLNARIDTGATTTSLHAIDVIPYERDGKDWVKFTLEDKRVNKIVKLNKPLARVVYIKRHGAERQKRYVVKMILVLGKHTKNVEVSLTDRSDFSFPVLIGRNFLSGEALVDVSQEYVTAPLHGK